jgi:uncharacterized protein
MKQGSCCVVCKLATLLAGLGALNWGLLALFQIDLVASAFGGMTTASKAVYVIIGVAGVVKLLSLFVQCPCCKPDGASCTK